MNKTNKIYQKLKDTVGKTVKKTKRAKLELLENQAEIEASFQKICSTDFMCFARGINIACDSGPVMFDSCMAPYQRDCFKDLDENLKTLIKGEKPEKRRFWIERTKKAGKDSDLAICVLWLIAFSNRPFYIQVGAADKQQASIVKERITHLLHWNLWLNEYIEVHQWEVRSKKTQENGQPLAKLHIMSSEIAGAHGGTPDLLIINELSHVTRWEFAENLMDNADGVANGMVIIATNAGFKGTKAEVWRNNAINSKGWTTHFWSKPAPWHNKESIEDARNRNRFSRFQRLWYGKWVSGKGDALDENDIDRCFRLLKGKGPLKGPEDGWMYVAGLDLGVSHDHSGLVVLGINTEEQILKTAFWKAWRPSRGIDVNLIDVEKTCVSMSKLFRLQFLFYDPHQAKLMGQRLRKQNVPAREMSFQKQGNLVSMASCMLQVVETGKLQCYDDEDQTLRRDFGKFNIVEKSYGHKLEAVSDEFGHADVGTALMICLPFAVDMLEGTGGLLPDDDLVIDDDGKEMTQEEYDDMPQEFKELYEAYDEMAEEQKDLSWDSFSSC